MTRIALLSDIHGNSIALDAVLADIDERGGADEHWVLGDVVADSAQPNVLLPNELIVRQSTAAPRQAS